MEPLDDSLKSESIFGQCNDTGFEFSLGGDLNKEASDGTSDVSVFLLNETIIEKKSGEVEEVQTKDVQEVKVVENEEKESDVKAEDKDKTDGREVNGGTFKLRLTSTLRNKRIQAVAVSDVHLSSIVLNPIE